MATAESAARPDRPGARGRAKRAQALACVFHALSDPRRLRVLELLRLSDLCVCDLAEALEMHQSLLSFHLKTLKEAGLLVDRRDGRWIHYSVVPAALDDAREILGELMEVARPKEGACCKR